MTTAIVCTALLGLLLFLLGLSVSAARGGAAAGAYPNDPADPFFKWIRAHGNTAEYAPMMAVLMLLVGSRNRPSGCCGLWVSRWRAATRSRQESCPRRRSRSHIRCDSLVPSAHTLPASRSP